MGPVGDFFWLVGILEGEGSFLAPPPSRPNEPRIEIEMADQDTMQRVAALVGASCRLRSKTLPAGYRQIYRVRLAGQRAVRLMQTIKPFLCQRRQEQIDKACKAYKVPRPYTALTDLPKFELVRLRETPFCATPHEEEASGLGA